jgi:hypothetical protein
MSIALLLLGVIFFLHQESWIIISIPHSTIMQKAQSTIQTKETSLWIFTQGTFKKETTEIMINSDHAQTIKQLLNNWLNTLEEENIIDKKIIVQSVILSPSGQDAFICFQDNFLNKQTSCYIKLMILESMLKTLKDAKLGLNNVRLLMHHQPMIDPHFNFDISWPISGFIG